MSLTSTKLIPILAILLITSSLQQSPTDSEPQMIVELWRHGARSAARDTYNQKYVRDNGPGNIIGNGMRMHYNLGRAIREKYKDNIFKNTNYTHYKVLTTTFQRTILSAYSHMMGLFPPGTGKTTSNDIKSTKLPPFKGATDDNSISNNALPYRIHPVPIYTINKTIDDYFMKGMKYKCPKADKRKDEIFDENVKNKPNIFDSVTPIIEKKYPCKDYFEGKSKYDLNTLGIFSDVNKCYFFSTGHPMEGTESVFEKMKYIFGIYYINSKYTNINIRKLYTSNMAKDIIQKFEQKIAGETELRFFGLSGHEANVVPFMLGYDLTSEDCLVKKLNGKEVKGICYGSPEFAANFIWELSKKGEEHFMRVLYDGEAITSCAKDKELEGKYCKFADFKAKMTEAFVLSDSVYKKTCGVSLNPDGTKPMWAGWKWTALILMVVSICLLIGFCFTLSKGKKEESMKPDLDADESYSKL